MATKTNWGGGKQAPSIIRGIESRASTLLTGKILAIDPASRSMGFALFIEGKLHKKGELIAKSKEINLRLQELQHSLAAAPLFNDVDILVIEKIRGSHAHDYLKWSIGMAVAAVGAPKLIEVPIGFWKKIAPEDYDKTDADDAELIGLVVMTIAREYHAAKTARGKTKRVGSAKKVKARKQKVKRTRKKTRSSSRGTR